jgi:hypothetical protein
MSRFPLREPDIQRLANDIIKGLSANPDQFPAPPSSADEIKSALEAYEAGRDAMNAGATTAKSGITAKNQALTTLVDRMKGVLTYAESLSRNDAGKLHLLGWGSPRGRVANEAAGQPQNVVVVNEGKGWLELEWTAPSSGGTPTAYRVRRRKPGATDWVDVGMSVETSIRLTDQEAGAELEYQVIAVNKVGEGAPSNVVRVVL